ncbi:hypothetical protein D3C81_1451500 [compost metagenome]
MGKCLPECADGIGQRRHGIHDVHDDRQLGLQSIGNRARFRFESVHAAHHLASLRQQRSPFLGQPGVAAAAIEELDANLPFQIGQRMADDRLRAPEFAARSGKASFVSGGDKRAELVQRDGVEHVSTI